MLKNDCIVCMFLWHRPVCACVVCAYSCVCMYAHTRTYTRIPTSHFFASNGLKLCTKRNVFLINLNFIFMKRYSYIVNGGFLILQICKYIISRKLCASIDKEYNKTIENFNLTTNKHIQ